MLRAPLLDSDRNATSNASENFALTPGVPVSAGRDRKLTDRGFCSFYDLCSNPTLTLRGLMMGCREELNNHPMAAPARPWEEHLLNLYLLICAIACTTDDYLAGRAPDLSPGTGRNARFQSNLWLRVLNLVRDRSIMAWRQRWDDCIDEAGEMLACGAPPADSQVARLRRAAENLLDAAMPQRFLRQRPDIREPFHFQRFAHREILAMAEAFLASNLEHSQPLLVLGARPAGAYLAPLVKAHLKARGWPGVDWVSIQPGERLSHRERQHLRLLRCPEVRVLIVHDSTGAGKGLRMLLGFLRRHGAGPERLDFLVPEDSSK